MTIKELTNGVSDRLPARADVLRALGLQQERAVANATFALFGMFGLGVVIGGAVALLLAPRPGRALRRDLADRLETAKERMTERFSGRPAAENVQ